ncbi:MAG: acetylxylan esterase [Verrucomicrobiota bacterium]
MLLQIKTVARHWIILASIPQLIFLGGAGIHAEDSLPPLEGKPAPTTLREMWQGFDPLRDPLETEIVHEWKEGDVTYRYVIFTIGTFKGQKSRVAAFYGFPKGDHKLPGLMHLHGGGQRAFIDEVKDCVKYGYAGLSVNWGGREMENAQPGDKNTDYNAIDPHDKNKHLDDGSSPRNSGWFMWTLVARRGITFLQQQPQVDPTRIGVYGHSMGGKITVDVAGIDQRVTAAVPSCGSSTSITYGGKIWNIPNSFWKRKTAGNIDEKTIDTQAYLPTLTCPILDLNPSNDHNSPMDLVTEDWEKIGSKQVYHSAAPHLEHVHLPETKVCQWLWFEQWLKHKFEMPKNPEITVDFKSGGRVPRVILKPDATRKIKAVDIYYSTDPHIITRFWRDGEAEVKVDTYQAICPILSLTNPFYAFANVTYALEEPFNSKYGIEHYTITSKELIILPDELKAAGMKATDKPTLLMEDFSRGWHDWAGHWDETGGTMTTRKIKDPKWRGPDGTSLCLEVKSVKDSQLKFTFGYNAWEAYDDMGPYGSYSVVREIKGNPDWQTISVNIEDLQPPSSVNPQSGKLPASPTNKWQRICDLTLNGKVDEVRKIYWAKMVQPSQIPQSQVMTDTPKTTTGKQQDDLPELQGQSAEFKEAVRKSLAEERKGKSNP